MRKSRRRTIHRPWTCVLGLALLFNVGVCAWQGDTVLRLSIGVALGVGNLLFGFVPKEPR